MTPTVQRFDRCTACGSAIQTALAERKHEFLIAVFNDSEELGRLSGLAEIRVCAHQLDKQRAELSC